MPINTTTLPFINKMLMPASGAEAGQGIADFIGGFMGAHEARSRLDKADEEANAEIVARGGDPNPPHRFENFVKAFNRAPGVVAEGATPYGESKGRIFAAETKGLERTNSLNDQLDRLVKDPVSLANEVANLPIDNIPDWLTHNAGLLANPIGAKMWQGVAESYKQTKLGQIQAGRMKHLSQLAAQNLDLDVTNPDDLAIAEERARKIAPSVAGAPLSTVTFDPVTGQPRPTYKAEDDLKAARTDLINAQIKALEEGKKIKPTDFEANVGFINEQLKAAGKPPLTNDEFMEMANVHMGVRARASAAQQWFDRDKVNALVKEHSELQKEINELQTSAPPRTKGQKEQRAQSVAAKLARQAKVDEELEKIRTRLETESKGGTVPSTAPKASYQDAEEVRNDFRSGKLSKDEALQILKDKFGFKE